MKFESSVWRDVFQNFKDTRLLIDVLKSTTAIYSTSTQDTPAELLKSVESIQKFITFHTSNYKLLKCNCVVKDVHERNIDVKRRQHAVLFFSVLKSLKVTSSEADEYYETVHFGSCNIIWYFDLLCHLHWHECFVHCAKQLPDDVMLYVSEQLLTLESEDKSFSLYYVIMQSIIWKLFMQENIQLSTYEEQSPKFSFPFILPEDLAQNNSNEKLIKLYKQVLQNSLALVKSEQSKLLLHAIKLILKILLKVKTFEGSFVKDLFCLTASHISDGLLQGIENTFPECDVQDSVYREESAGISMEYLILIICAYYDEFKELISREESCFSLVSSDVECLLTKTKGLIKDSFLMQAQLEENQKVLTLLKAAIQNNYPCGFKAAEIALNQPEILSSPKFIEVLNKNKKVLQKERNLIVLLNAAFLQEGNEKPLIILLFNVLSSTPKAIYYNFLKYRINHFGTQTELKHPAFSDQIDQFGRKILDYEEAEKVILPLLVQSPHEVLSTIVAQALDQGKEGMDLIKVLTNVMDLIHSSNANLLTEISFYFSSAEENHVKKMKHIPLVMETLVKNSPGSLFEKLMEICILPHLCITCDRLEVVLNCLIVALQNLEKNENRRLNRQLVLEYLQKCGALLNDCIISHRSKTKQQVIEGMRLMCVLFQKDFINREDIASLKSDFKHYNPTVLIYMNGFLGMSVYEILESPAVNLNELMWTWCCSTNDQEILQKCISHPQFSHEELLKVLNSVFLHFTLEEWIQSSLYIRGNCKHLHPSLASSQKPWKLNDSNFRFYATVKCLIDSLSSILKNNSDTSVYACSNFTNTVMNLLNGQDTQPESLLYIFMDMCVLSNMKDFWKTFSSFLIAILKETYHCCKDENQKKIFRTLFTNILKHIPESEDKQAILEAV